MLCDSKSDEVMSISSIEQDAGTGATDAEVSAKMDSGDDPEVLEAIKDLECRIASAFKELQILQSEHVKLHSDKQAAVAQAQKWKSIALQLAVEKREAITHGEQWEAKSREWQANAHIFMLKWLSNSQKPDLPLHLSWMNCNASEPEPDLSPQMPWMNCNPSEPEPDVPLPVGKPTQPSHPPPPELLVARSNSKSPIRRRHCLRLQILKCKVKCRKTSSHG